MLKIIISGHQSIWLPTTATRQSSKSWSNMTTSKLMHKPNILNTLLCTWLQKKDIHQLWLCCSRVEPTSMLKILTSGHHSMGLPGMATRQWSKNCSNITTSKLMHKPNILNTLLCTWLQMKDIHQLWLCCSRGEPTSMLKVMTSGHHSMGLQGMAKRQSSKNCSNTTTSELMQKPNINTLLCTGLQKKDIHQSWLCCSRVEPTSMLKLMTL